MRASSRFRGQHGRRAGPGAQRASPRRGRCAPPVPWCWAGTIGPRRSRGLAEHRARRRPAICRASPLLVASPGVPLTHPAPHPVIAAAQAAGVRGAPATSSCSASRLRARPHRRASPAPTASRRPRALIHHLLAACRDAMRCSAAISAGRCSTSTWARPTVDRPRAVVLPARPVPAACVPASPCWLNLTPGPSRPARRPRRLRRRQGADLPQPAAAGDWAIVGIDDAPSAAVADRLREPRRDRVSPRRPVEGGVCRSWTAGCYESARRRAAVPSAVSTASPACAGGTTSRTPPWPIAAWRALGIAPERAAGRARQLRRAWPIGWRRSPAIGPVLWVNDSKATNPDSARQEPGSFADIFWIAGGKPKPGGFAQLRPHLGHVRGGLPDRRRRRPRSRPTSAISCRCAQAARSEAGRAPAPAPRRGQRRERRPSCCWRPACASFDQFTELRASRRRVPGPGREPGARGRGGRHDRLRRAPTARSLGAWWWTVDRMLLAGIALLAAVGVILVFAASPAVSERIYGDGTHFVVKHIMFLVPAARSARRRLDAGAARRAAPGGRDAGPVRLSARC